jgi:hypothetical protein
MKLKASLPAVCDGTRRQNMSILGTPVDEECQGNRIPVDEGSEGSQQSPVASPGEQRMCIMIAFNFAHHDCFQLLFNFRVCSAANL